MVAIDQFHSALDFALEKLAKAELSLKEAQYEALKSVVFKGKDTICILPTGYGKSLIYQLLPNVFDFFLSSEENSSSMIVVSPLNALMQDRINKVRGHLNVRILKDHRYSVGQKVDGSTMTEQLKMVPPQILFSHPEILIENKKVFNDLLKSKIYKDRTKAIVVDEAHLVVEW
ncbi:ATP-dependent DNA helicase Q5 [Acropora cervicornis]|uniref:DNA 3'-5' helicase n=1 Tax=Acropora cervicornis TaxID=6130 RepID=A0AAD9USD4_ACRCE|nr:ATP-dependent DNA helicase Q5 [Acropora cervicornis]